MPEPPTAAKSRLAPCPDRPNCVSTEAADRRHRVPPIPFRGAPELALARMAAVIEAQPRATLRHREPGGLHAEFRSRVFAFVDDVDVEVDAAAGVLRFRSASRMGHWDLGVNRRRMKRLARAFRAAEGSG
ncbi:MAG TPA: DUF1499 domain-containing protein [Thermoanaerobaculia bacterium]|nr:DUF1499 domain-containing protein [Thermoanaerobaculia bacterium]